MTYLFNMDVAISLFLLKDQSMDLYLDMKRKTELHIDTIWLNEKLSVNNFFIWDHKSSSI